jgi:hypothetical protein
MREEDAVEKIITERQRREMSVQLATMKCTPEEIEKRLSSYTVVDELPPSEPRHIEPVSEELKFIQRRQFDFELTPAEEAKHKRLREQKASQQVEIELNRKIAQVRYAHRDNPERRDLIIEQLRKEHSGKTPVARKPLLLEGSPEARKKVLREALDDKRISRDDYRVEFEKIVTQEVEELYRRNPSRGEQLLEEIGAGSPAVRRRTWMDKRRQLLEQKCRAGCDCESCRLTSFKQQLDQMVSAGRCTVEQAEHAYKIRCSL